MRSFTKVGLALASFMLLKADGCGETVARATCDGTIAKLDLSPNQCVPVPNCFVPADQVYDARYAIELRSLAITEPATSTVTMDASTWLSTTFGLPAGAQDVSGRVQIADGMTLRVCATAAPPVDEAVTRLDLFVSKPGDANFVAGLQQVDVRVAVEHPFRGVIEPEDDPSKVDMDMRGDGSGLRVLLRQDSRVKFTIRGSGGKPLGRQYAWSVESPVTLEHTDGPEAWMLMTGEQADEVKIRVEVQDPGRPMEVVTWTGSILPVGVDVGIIEGPTRVYPGGEYEWTRRCWQTFTHAACRRNDGWSAYAPDGEQTYLGEESSARLRMEKVGRWTIEAHSSGRLIVTSTY